MLPLVGHISKRCGPFYHGSLARAHALYNLGPRLEVTKPKKALSKALMRGVLPMPRFIFDMVWDFDSKPWTESMIINGPSAGQLPVPRPVQAHSTCQDYIPVLVDLMPLRVL
jgi:hypothetical protein